MLEPVVIFTQTENRILSTNKGESDIMKKVKTKSFMNNCYIKCPKIELDLVYVYKYNKITDRNITKSSKSYDISTVLPAIIVNDF